MESLDLTYKLIALKIKSKTLDQIYFMSSVFQEHSHCYDNYLFLLPPLPSPDGGVVATPNPQLFSWQKFLKNFFIDTWVSGQRVGKWTV